MDRSRLKIAAVAEGVVVQVEREARLALHSLRLRLLSGQRSGLEALGFLLVRRD